MPNEEIEYNSDTDNLFNDIAPELTDQPPLIVLPASFLEDESDVIRKYLRKAKDKYIKLKTLLYADNPKPFMISMYAIMLVKEFGLTRIRTVKRLFTILMPTCLLPVQIMSS